ncbi:hypothetical protein Ancab_014495 [Ancistrocladus abbreviatus]
MTTQEELMGSASMMIKGKRTKRPRPSSPLALAMSSVSYNSEEGGGDNMSTTTATSARWDDREVEAADQQVGSTEEEEDMANCLILLARGNNQITPKQQQPILPITTKSTSSSTAAITTTAFAAATAAGAGVYAYECKTCNRSFPSFQALGGHRASHKKPKLQPLLLPPNEEDKRVFPLLLDDHLSDDNSGLSLQIAIASRVPCNSNTNSKVKVHECTICGAEFSSGQALGGHMRRHRALLSGPTSSASGIPVMRSDEAAKRTTGNLLSLDLNLPAPEDDQQQQQQQHQHQREHQSKFVFASNEKTLVFSASLVDCHY